MAGLFAGPSGWERHGHALRVAWWVLAVATVGFLFSELLVYQALLDQFTPDARFHVVFWTGWLAAAGLVGFALAAREDVIVRAAFLFFGLLTVGGTRLIASFGLFFSA